MQAIGIVRRLDDIGRLVIPKEYRNKLGIGMEDPVEISLVDSAIIINKAFERCALCGSTEKLSTFAEALICLDCVKNIKNLSDF